MDEHSRLRAPILGVVCLGYLLLRLWGLGDSCLWFDEIFSVHAAEHPWNEILWFVAQDLIHPPLFYLLLKVWISIGGEALYWLRLFPVFFSLLALVPFYLLCRELKLKFTTILLALAFFSVNGALIKYAQEVRMYSLLLFLSLVSLWLFSRFFFRGKNIWFLTIVNLLMVYTHYFGWCVIAAEVLAIFVFQRIKIRHVLIMFAIEVIAFVPWMWGLWKAVGTGADVNQNIGWIQRPGLYSLLDLLFDVAEPFYFQQSSAEPSSLLYITVPLIILIAAARVFFFTNWKNYERKEVFYLLCIFALLPVAAAFVLSWLLPLSIWGSRHLIVVFAPTSILVAIVVAGIDIRPVRYAFFGIILGVLVISFSVRTQQGTERFIWCAWEEVVEPLSEAETIYAFEGLSAYHLWFATRDKPDVKIVKINGVPETVDDAAYFLPRGSSEVNVTNADEIVGERFFFAFRDTEWNEHHPPLNYLRSRGYTVKQIAASKPAQGSRVFLGEATQEGKSKK